MLQRVREYYVLSSGGSVLVNWSTDSRWQHRAGTDRATYLGIKPHSPVWRLSVAHHRDPVPPDFPKDSLPHRLGFYQFGGDLGRMERDEQGRIATDATRPSWVEVWTHGYNFLIPWWFPVGVTGLFAGVCLIKLNRRLVRRRRVLLGLCADCGKDVRLARGRCSYCGWPVPAKPPEPAAVSAGLGAA